MSKEDFSSVRLTECLNEMNDLRELFKRTNAQLADAEGVVRYYSDPHNYSIRPQAVGDICYQDVLKDDGEPAHNTKDTRVAGLRARMYFKKYANVSDS